MTDDKPTLRNAVNLHTKLQERSLDTVLSNSVLLVAQELPVI